MRRTNRERGAVSVEFLLSILAILFTMFWMWEIVMALYAGNVFADAAKVGVRYAISHGKYGSTQVETFTGCPYSTNPQCATWYYARYSLANGTFTTAAPGAESKGQIAIAIKCTNQDGTAASQCFDPNPPKVKDGTTPPQVEIEVAYPLVPYTALPLNVTLHAHAKGRMIN